jgi:hypothetical protein
MLSPECKIETTAKGTLKKPVKERYDCHARSRRKRAWFLSQARRG